MPVHVSGLLADLIDGVRKGRAAPMVRLCENWETLVGPAIAASSKPVGLKGPLLLVHVASSVWMQEFEFLRADLIIRINRSLPEIRISEIRFKIGPL